VRSTISSQPSHLDSSLPVHREASRAHRRSIFPFCQSLAAEEKSSSSLAGSAQRNSMGSHLQSMDGSLSNLDASAAAEERPGDGEEFIWQQSHFGMPGFFRQLGIDTVQLCAGEHENQILLCYARRTSCRTRLPCSVIPSRTPSSRPISSWPSWR